MTTEVEKLLSLFYQAGGQIKVENQQLFVAPAKIAQRFGEQIKKLKPEILLALGHCPVCVGRLTVKIEVIQPASKNATTGKTGRHAHCGLSPWHYDSWKF
jgi:hypothetical protein